MSNLIDRQAAIDAIRKIYDSVGILGEKWAVDKCQMAIKDLPSAQPEIMYYPQVDGVTASIIAQPEITNEEIRFALKQLGADMRGKQDDSF